MSFEQLIGNCQATVIQALQAYLHDQTKAIPELSYPASDANHDHENESIVDLFWAAMNWTDDGAYQERAQTGRAKIGLIDGLPRIPDEVDWAGKAFIATESFKGAVTSYLNST